MGSNVFMRSSSSDTCNGPQRLWQTNRSHQVASVGEAFHRLDPRIATCKHLGWIFTKGKGGRGGGEGREEGGGWEKGEEEEEEDSRTRKHATLSVITTNVTVFQVTQRSRDDRDAK